MSEINNFNEGGANSEIYDNAVTRFAEIGREVASNARKALNKETLELIGAKKGTENIDTFLDSIEGCEFTDKDITDLLESEISISTIRSVRLTSGSILGGKDLLEAAREVQKLELETGRVHI